MKRLALVLGDFAALLIVTLVGFLSHGEFSTAFLPRMAAALFPLLVGWYLLAPSLRLFEDSVTGRPSELWRPAFTMLFAGPLAAIMRGLLLQASVIPIFAVVLTTTGAVALTLWRLVWLLASRRAA